MRRQLLISTLVAFAATGCPPVLRPDAGGCDLTVCAPYGCDAETGHCRTDCRTTEDCLAGFTCASGFCVGDQCTAATAMARCGGFWCVNGVCSTDCTSAACAAGYYCNGDTRRCTPRCTTRDDALCEGFVCDLAVGECEPYCRDGEVPCATGYTCDAAMRCGRDGG